MSPVGDNWVCIGVWSKLSARICTNSSKQVESHRSAAVSDEVSLMLASISAGIPFSIECSLPFPRSASSIAFAISLDVSVSACQCEAISGFERGYWVVMLATAIEKMGAQWRTFSVRGMRPSYSVRRNIIQDKVTFTSMKMIRSGRIALSQSGET